MADKKWTEQQNQAIDARGGTVLVSAAAGSGKTAVLVERMISRIFDDENPTDANRLLVATFSNAAAREMKQRVMARLGSLIAQNPSDQRLQRQQILLGHAQISTIHSFCLELIRSNFQRLDLSAGVRTADDKELEIMRRDCAESVMEEFHSSEKRAMFEELIELLSVGRDDKRVFDTLFTLYDFARSHPFYIDWLEEKRALYIENVPVSESIWGSYILNYAKDALNYAIIQLEEAMNIIADDEAMQKAYHDAYLHDYLQLNELLDMVNKGDWDKCRDILGHFTFERLKPLKGDHAEKENVVAIRKRSRGIVEELRDDRFCASAEQHLEDLDALRRLVDVLFSLVRAFDTLFSAAKRDKNIMDFSDMEQFAATLLAERTPNGYAPTALAKTIQTLYDEVMIDEFQDTNAVQDMIFRAVSDDGKKMFMVGDVKQSIYRFRQARPELFMEKKKSFAPYDGKTFPAKIILGRNFRSAHEVTESINFFFSMLMSAKVGEIDYNDDEKLSAGADFPQTKSPRGCDIRILDTSQYDGAITNNMHEAEYVSAEIARMLEEEYQVSDNGNLRKVRPSDFCILLRSPSNKARIYREALEKHSVPAWSEPKNGFLNTKEIAPVLALLRIIGNPLLDIDLACVLISALFEFSADELANIRLAKPKAPLYIAIREYALLGDTHSNEFLNTLDSIRRSSSGSADETIRHIYELTDYEAKIQVMKMGQARLSNLLRLVQYARDYHNNGYRGLSGFVGFLDRLLERGGDLAPASSLSEQADVVRIMSIHHSKGLEFPIVFLCDTAKRFNREDLNGNTLLHTDLGFACVRRDFKMMKQYTTVPMQAIKLELERSMLSEELRVLYVALTRAKERVIITGVEEKIDERLAKLSSAVSATGKLPEMRVREAKSFLDWILMAIIHHPSLYGRISDIGACDDVFATNNGLTFSVISKLKHTSERQLPESGIEEANTNLELIKQLKSQLSFCYKYEAQTHIPTKLAVSKISESGHSNEYRFTHRPSFLESTGLTAAQRGNALHRFMQFSNYEFAAHDAAKELDRLTRLGFLSEAESNSISLQKLETFFKSKLAERIFASEKVYRELRFLAEVGNEILGEYTELLSGDAESKTAIQGVADCVFIENGKAIIVDYKTDYVKTSAELAEKYFVQLALYHRVLGESLGVPVQSCILYSFALSEEVTLKI